MHFRLPSETSVTVSVILRHFSKDPRVQKRRTAALLTILSKATLAKRKAKVVTCSNKSRMVNTLTYDDIERALRF